MTAASSFMADRPLRVAMIGTRAHAKYVLTRLPHLPNVRMVAAATGGDTIADIERYAESAGIPLQKFGEDWQRMLDEVRPEVLVVAGAFELHAAMCVAAIERGIHVFSEKLIALTEEELAEIRAVCARNPTIHLAGMMNGRYDAGFHTAWAMIRAGVIGNVRLMNVRKSYRLGKRPPFYADRATYGGTIPWVGSHAIDWALWFAGDAKPRSVYATHSARDNGGNGTMERSSAGVIEFDDEIAATFSVDVFRPEDAPTHGDDWARIVGTRGVIEARPAGAEVLPAATFEPPTQRHLFDDFIGHLIDSTTPLIDTASTLELTRVCLAARRSADERRVITL